MLISYICINKITVTTALKNILSKIGDLPAREQNAIAVLLKEELAWQKSYQKSQKKLEQLASEAMIEYGKGKTKPMQL